MSIPLPTIIQGPAYIKVGSGPVLYTNGEISLSGNVESWNPNSTFGPLGERHKSRKDVLTLTPVGMLQAAKLDYFYAAYKTPTAIGSSILAGAVVISSLAENKTYTWPRGGMSKPPGLMLKPTSTVFGSMEVTCIGAGATQPTNAAFWKAADGTVTPDTSFDESKIISDIYSAALGARGAPYNAMGGMDGFEIGFDFQTKEVPNGDVGIADIFLSGLGMTASFAPSNLTEAQADTLLALQDTTAVLPGQTYAKAGEDLVITGAQSGAVFTFTKMGAKKSERVYAIGEHRFKGLDFVNAIKSASGAVSALFAYTGVS